MDIESYFNMYCNVKNFGTEGDESSESKKSAGGGSIGEMGGYGSPSKIMGRTGGEGESNSS